MYRPGFGLKSILWEFHITDVDYWPSVPHGHSIGKNNLKINVYTGEIFNASDRTYKGSADKKEIKRLWSDKVFARLAEDARNDYLAKYPDKPLPQMPFRQGFANKIVIFQKGFLDLSREEIVLIKVIKVKLR